MSFAAVRHWMKDAKRTFIDPALERNEGPNLAEHPMWPELKRAREKKLEQAKKDERLARGPDLVKPR
jgi:hypothetical protein